jgi:hypothetical protein
VPRRTATGLTAYALPPASRSSLRYGGSKQGCVMENCRNPPGFTTRQASRNAASGSGMSIRLMKAVAKSKTASRNGSRCADVARALSVPCRHFCRHRRATLAGAGSGEPAQDWSPAQPRLTECRNSRGALRQIHIQSVQISIVP